MSEKSLQILIDQEEVMTNYDQTSQCLSEQSSVIKENKEQNQIKKDESQAQSKYKKGYYILKKKNEDLRGEISNLEGERTKYQLEIERLNKIVSSRSDNNWLLQQIFLNGLQQEDPGVQNKDIESYSQQTIKEELNRFIPILLKKYKEQADSQLDKLNKKRKKQKQKIEQLKQQLSDQQNKLQTSIRQDVLDDIIQEYDLVLRSKLLPGALTNYNRQFDLRYQEKDNENIKLQNEIKSLKEQILQINKETQKYFKKDFHISMFQEINIDQHLKLAKINKGQNEINQLQNNIKTLEKFLNQSNQDLLYLQDQLGQMKVENQYQKYELDSKQQFIQKLESECYRYFNIQVNDNTFSEINLMKNNELKRNQDQFNKEIKQYKSQLEENQQSNQNSDQDTKKKLENQISEKFQQQIKNLENQNQELEQQIQIFKRNDQQSEIVNLEKVMKQLKEDKFQLEINVIKLNNELYWISQRYEILKINNDRDKQEINEKQQQLIQNLNNLQIYESNINERNDKIKSLESDLKQAQQESNQQRDKLLLSEKALQNSQQSSFSQQIQSQNYLNQIRQEREKFEDLKADFENKKMKLNQVNQAYSQKIQDQELEIQKLQQQIYQLESKQQNQKLEDQAILNTLNSRINYQVTQYMNLEQRNKNNQLFLNFMSERINKNQKFEKIQPLFPSMQEFFYKQNKIQDPFDNNNMNTQEDKFQQSKIEFNKDLIKEIVLSGYPPNFQLIIEIITSDQPIQQMMKSINQNSTSSFFNGYFLKQRPFTMARPLQFLSSQIKQVQSIQNCKFFIIREERQSISQNKLQEAQGLIGNYYLLDYFINNFNLELQQNNLDFPKLELPSIKCIQKLDSEQYYYIEEIKMESQSQINNNSKYILYINALKYYSYYHSNKQYMISEINIFGNCIYDAIISSKYQILSSYDQGNEEILKQSYELSPIRFNYQSYHELMSKKAI